MTKEQIVLQLPYTQPFLFVDKLEEITDDGVVGKYTFRSTSEFYQGHFKAFPVTPGVLLTECCAQIGLVCLGIYLMKETTLANPTIALTSTEMEFLQAVYPEETVTVISRKIYFRFQKLKCAVRMMNSKDELVCKGRISGMLKAS